MASSVSNTQSTALTVYEPPVSPKSYLRRAYDLFMERSFKGQIADYRHFHRNWMGDVVVLVGTSTAGKTSIIKALRQLEPDRAEDGIDLRCDVELLRCLRKHAPDDVDALEHFMNSSDIIKAVFGEERPYKASTSEAQKIEAEQVIQKLKKTVEALPKEELDAVFKSAEPKMFDEAFEYSRQGRSMICDALDVDVLARYVRMRNFDGPMRVVLTYCPFHRLSSRMEQRNKEAQASGNLSNQRIGEFPFLQFSDLYSKKEVGQTTLEVITRQQAITTFDKHFDQGTADKIRDHQAHNLPIPSAEEILMEKESTRQRFLENLGFEDGIDSVEIAPRNEHQYHFIIDSSRFAPIASAKFLHEESGL